MIRYFKNLFTQAPALFFFVTDKGYYDVVVKRIATARKNRSYAIEHTFFTHRVFVTRPRLEECLEYMRKIIASPDAGTSLDAIESTRQDRLRSLEEMSPLEQRLRVLLFQSQDHFFDLKNALGQFVVINHNKVMLRFDDSGFSRSDLGLAAFHFFVEQKMMTYHFGGGRDYANEALRNSLFAVFDSLGSDGTHQAGALYPPEEEGEAELSIGERRRIQEAVDSLLDDLHRGGAVEVHRSEGPSTFRWIGKDPALAFSPVAQLLPYEEELALDLRRMGATARLWAIRAQDSEIPADSEDLGALSEELDADSSRFGVAVAATSNEEAESIRAEAEKKMGRHTQALVQRHASILNERFGFRLHPLTSPALRQPSL